MVDESAFHVDVNISEADLANLRVGQAAKIELDALPGQQLDGTLDYIAPTGTTQQNVTTYLARVTLKPDGQQLRAGLSAAVSIITDKRSDVLLVPNGAIQETDSGPQVEVKNGTETKPMQIKIGLVGDLVHRGHIRPERRRRGDAGPAQGARWRVWAVAGDRVTG